MKKFCLTVLLTAAAIGTFAAAFAAQTNRNVKKNNRATPTATPAPTATPEPAATPAPAKASVKKNERPNGAGDGEKTPAATAAPNFFYEFAQPAFTIPRIRIEHDESGVGRISFLKNVSNEEITDPIRLSTVTLERISAALAALDFLNSTESYQYEKDYSHLGNITFRVSRDGRSRETKFNWTQNPNAKALADEYRRIGNQYIWLFEMNVARENQPLESPKLMTALEGYLRRGEISDPEQLVPYLKELGDDERLPLIARNHAARLVRKITDKK